MDITERLKQLRMQKSLKQEEVGRILKVSKQAYGRYENGTRELSLKAIIVLAEFYNVSIDYLMGVSNDPTRR